MTTGSIRWLALVPLGVSIALAECTFEAGGLLKGFLWRVEWLWLLAFVTSLNVGQPQSVWGFGCCGALYDVMLGIRPGSGLASFVLIGAIFVWLGQLRFDRGFAAQMFSAGLGAAGVVILRGLLAYGFSGVYHWITILWRAIGNGIFSMIAFLPLLLFLSLPAARTWSSEGRMYS